MITKIQCGLIGIMIACPAFADKGTDELCALITRLSDVFKILRVLAFIGAAFYIGGWAWSWLTGWTKDSMGDLKNKGIGLLVGFSILFMIGIVLSGVLSAANPGGSLRCSDAIGSFGGLE